MTQTLQVAPGEPREEAERGDVLLQVQVFVELHHKVPDSRLGPE